MFWCWKMSIGISAKLLKIIEQIFVPWLFTSQWIALARICSQNRSKMNLIIRVIGHITLSCTLRYSLNERKLKQNTHLKQDLCSEFSRWSWTGQTKFYFEKKHSTTLAKRQPNKWGFWNSKEISSTSNDVAVFQSLCNWRNKWQSFSQDEGQLED